MYDLTSGETGKVLRFNLQSVDDSQDPPVVTPLNLSAVTQVVFQYGWGSLYQPVGPLKQVNMLVADPVNGVVQYTTLPGDLDAPVGFPFTGKIEYIIKVVSPGQIMYSSDIGIFTVKEKVGT